MVKFKSNLWKRYQGACNKYLEAFCNKHEFDYDDAKESWVAGLTGSVVCCGDFFFSLEEIILDIEYDVPENEIFKWYAYYIDLKGNGDTAVNYYSWILSLLKERKSATEQNTGQEMNDSEKLEATKKKFKEMLDEYGEH